jgi:phosphinothricin acetyltransferase
MIRPAPVSDAPALAGIYNHYVLNTVVTFEEEAVSAEDMAQRIRDTLEAELPWLVWEEDGRVLGYCHASKWKSRCAYRFALETTVYLDPDATGRGLGTKLYTALIDTLRPTRMHALIGGIALPNDASVALHEKLGFQKIGQFREVGWKFGRWVDVGYWELMLGASAQVAE